MVGAHVTKAEAMTMLFAIFAVLAFGYLFFAIVNPERF